MERRAPGRDKSATPRKEKDMPKIISGVLDGFTTGMPLCALIENGDTRSSDYSYLKDTPRPSHADFAAYSKYHGFEDYRGGGHFSGRVTAAIVAVGAIAISALQKKGIKIAVFSDYPRVKQRIRALDFSDETISQISGIYSAEDFGSQKPATRPFLEIAQNLGVKPENCLVVGDRDDTDGDGARNTNMEFIQIETHKTKVKHPNHPVWSWDDFATWVLEGMEPLQD